MSTASPMDRVRQLLEAHNEKSQNPIKVDEYFVKLAELGGTTDETCAAATWEDHQDAGLPRILARQAATIFRNKDPDMSKDQSASGPERIVVMDDDPEKLARKMTPAELIEKFPVDRPKHAFSLKLAELSEGRRFMVYTREGKKDIPTSVRLFEELDDFGEREEVRVDKDPIPRKVYMIGERPGRSADEHPLYDDIPLRPGGISNVDCDWSKVDVRVKQVLFLAVRETGELDMDCEHEVDVHSEAVEDGMEKISRKYPKATLRLDELDQLGELPAMKILLNSSRKKGGKSKQNPFVVGNKRT